MSIPAHKFETPDHEHFAPNSTYQFWLEWGSDLDRNSMSLGLGYTLDNEICFLFNTQTEEGEMLLRHNIGDQAFEQASKIIGRLHLCDQNGIPFKVVENGVFCIKAARNELYQHSRLQPEYLKNYYTQQLAKHLRVELDVAANIVENFDLEKFEEYCNECKPRWQEEANEAIAFLEQLKRECDQKQI